MKRSVAALAFVAGLLVGFYTGWLSAIRHLKSRLLKNVSEPPVEVEVAE
jgi:uncharacterized protein YneF (UPF0154 family)